MIDKFAYELLEKILLELKKNKNIDKIKIVLKPLINYISNKLYPYIIIISTLIILNFIMNLIILTIIFKNCSFQYSKYPLINIL